MKFRIVSVSSFVLAISLLSTTVLASVIIERNPFDPSRKPWKAETPPPPPMPELTPKDLQIEAIIAFGQFRGVVAQLDGKLKGVLPANAAGKVRIAVGQAFGGYVLENIEPRGALIKAGQQQFMVPMVRRTFSGSAPVPAFAAPAATTPAPPALQAPSAPQAPNAPQAQGAGPFGQAQPMGGGAAVAGAPAQSGAPAGEAQSAAAAQQPAAAQAEAAAQPQPSAAVPGQPMSLLDAIRKAQEASRANTGGAAPASPQGLPFFGKQ